MTVYFSPVIIRWTGVGFRKAERVYLSRVLAFAKPVRIRQGVAREIYDDCLRVIMMMYHQLGA